MHVSPGSQAQGRQKQTPKRRGSWMFQSRRLPQSAITSPSDMTKDQETNTDEAAPSKFHGIHHATGAASAVSPWSSRPQNGPSVTSRYLLRASDLWLPMHISCVWCSAVYATGGEAKR